MASHGGDFDYEAHGAGYAAIRRPDSRIEALVHAALGDARTVLNVGAGAGSYEPTDRHVIALEPAAAMRAQRGPDRVPAIAGFAEALPLDDGAVDAVMAIMTVHQWSDLDAGLAELRRVSRGPVVVLAGDGDRLPLYWLNDYAPDLIAAEQLRYPPIAHIARRIGRTAQVQAVPIPLDCTDGFTEAFYGRPERLLDPAVRKAQSSWGFMPEGAEARFVESLSADLASGHWDDRHVHLRTQPTFESSMRLIVGQP
ncbi:MAG: class I SAM-dependent methyltransferase [Alphaproteobacteria bacterium]|nr:class I SAM-dependent methyltransferase [Alphaproteobacteria bacterium]MBU1513343.1 class I SAM-dependent methyltransferase [Alphaproteobacteria bacterium]MBU2096335.1 class I SAM-dependent methyltransferase [Alphaproteobacteria bacterium]MBU2149973.1 class I SAM-dependent methyltransferase [Alphaproteobacteria bacterium]MBU2309829.1 class I SAM-dependent methyltransferase [Alphaproteobacteria bacterium]